MYPIVRVCDPVISYEVYYPSEGRNKIHWPILKHF
uniref:Uncharacterized protein n=1 Tax=Arundo donax TaxID=35708 RepID=A0A0A8YYM9_ARUDO